jgi:aspartyl-tRNA(Asn)/glutamyl-tRNA(Gln) amidotransferase subunit C
MEGAGGSRSDGVGTIFARAMSGPLDDDVVREVARLARLALQPDEVQLMGRQLGRILEYVSQVQASGGTGAAPVDNLAVRYWLRADEPRPPLSAGEALANAPARAGAWFRTPPVL